LHAPFSYPASNQGSTTTGNQNVGFLLGAGASYLAGKGYPLASQLWPLIRNRIKPSLADDIQRKLDIGAVGIEEALDLLDEGKPEDLEHRHAVASAVAEHFAGIDPYINAHRDFLRFVDSRQDNICHIFSLNYDPIVELAADEERIRIIDGFGGMYNPYFDPTLFRQVIGYRRIIKWRPIFDQLKGMVHLYKLHGSIGWYEASSGGVRRGAFTSPLPSGARQLMIPPQRRKASDTGAPPYSTLWSHFRDVLTLDTPNINRLIVIGYSMRDEHVNVVLANALHRPDFTMIILTKTLEPAILSRWMPNEKVILVTDTVSSCLGKVGAGLPRLADFESFLVEINNV
jgi:SIR2-like domain